MAGLEYVLPTNIIPPENRMFDHWEIDGKKVTKLLPTDNGNKRIVAIRNYNN